MTRFFWKVLLQTSVVESIAVILRCWKVWLEHYSTGMYCATVTFPCWKVSLYLTLRESIITTFLYFLRSYIGKHCCQVPLLESMAITSGGQSYSYKVTPLRN